MAQDWISKIQFLLNQADDPGCSPAEAESFRAMAQKHMDARHLEEKDLIGAKGSGSMLTPTEATIDICHERSPYKSSYDSMASHIMWHCGLRGVLKYRREGAQLIWTIEVHGFQSDIDYFTILYTNARLSFASHLEPAKEENLSDAENVYRMRKAGMTRIKIAEIMGYGTDQGATAKVTRLYKQHCRVVGEDPKVSGKAFSLSNYIETYRETFVNTIWERLYRARNAADGNDGALVLASRKEKVEEAFYEKYPQYRPEEPSEDEKGKEETKPPSKRELARREKAARERRDRRRSASGQAGNSAGYAAAQTVDIVGVTAQKRL